MKTFNLQGAQGDVLLVRIDDVPSDAVEAEPVNGCVVLAHSETGHHHSIRLTRETEVEHFIRASQDPADPLTGYLRVASDFADLEHCKSGPHAHGTIRIPQGVYEIRRAREWNPWTRSDRRVVD